MCRFDVMRRFGMISGAVRFGMMSCAGGTKRTFGLLGFCNAADILVLLGMVALEVYCLCAHALFFGESVGAEPCLHAVEEHGARRMLHGACCMFYVACRVLHVACCILYA